MVAEPIHPVRHPPASPSVINIGITTRLFLAILATVVAGAIAVGLADRLSFEHGFREYIREREAQRLESLSATLADVWREHGDWEFLRNNDALWQRMTRPARPDRDAPNAGDAPPLRDAPPLPRDNGLRGENPPPAKDFGPPREHPPPPPKHAYGRDMPPPGRPPDADAAVRPRPPERPFGPPGGGPAAPTLLDDQRHVVVGSAGNVSATLLVPIVVDGATVGWLAGAELREPFGGAERRLQEQQAKSRWIIGGLAILLAGAVALVLARGFLAPLKRLTGATHRLAAGDYATRIDSNRGDELGQLVQDFNRLADALERNERMRRDFMADVSHELRTPLAILRGELEALEDGIRELNADTLKSLQVEVATLSKVVDDLYDLSLADVGALAYHNEDFDFAALVHAALGAFSARFAARDIAVDATLPADVSLPVHGDPDRLTQVLNNLFENSARYTDPGGSLRVALGRRGDRIELDLQDTSPGVEPAVLPRLFDRFYRTEGSRNRASGGAGLGLALCRSIIAGHRGTIDARPSPLGGLWILVTLPLRSART
jgi:two-component system sensor histidine kinase BaeS